MKASRRVAAEGPFPGEGAEVEVATGKGRVLRLRAGEAVEVFFPGEGYAPAEAMRVEKRRIVTRIAGPLRRGLSNLPVVAALSPPKGARLAWAVEKLAEAGVREVRFVACARSVRGRVDPARLGRVATAATMQAGWNAPPRIRPVEALSKFLEAPPEGERVLLDASAEASLAPADGPAVFLVGPEGGWTAEERERVEEAGFSPRSLGPGTYRVETAAVVAAGIYANRFGAASDRFLDGRRVG